jgi:membrane protease YdiL (CAAX protease family)
LIVIFLAFGYFIFGSILSVIDPTANPQIANSHLRFLIIYESVVLLVLWKFLFLRGWKLQYVGLMPSVIDTVIGIGLFFVSYIIFAVIWNVSSIFVPGLRQQASSLVTQNLYLPLVLIISIINPIFEEVFVCGYVVTALKKTRSISFAVNVSTGIRLAYHLYQGVIGVILIIPLGLIFGFWFGKTGRLWPIVIAHGILDFLGFIAYVN